MRTDSRFVRRGWHLPLLAGLLLFLAQPLFAAWAPPYPLIDTREHASLGLFLSWTLDEPGKLGLAQAQALDEAKFSVPEEEVLHFGYTGAALWVRVALQNPGSQDEQLVLQVPHPGLARVDFFRPVADGYQQVAAGTGSAQVIGDIAGTDYLFNIDVPAGSTRVAWFRVQSDQPLAFSLHLLPTHELAAAQAARHAVNGLLLGLLLGLVVFNAAAWLLQRQPEHGWYLLYLGSVSLFLAAVLGYAGVMYLRVPGLQWRLEVGGALLATLASLQFARAFLLTRETQPALDGMLRYLLVAVLVCLVAQWLLEPAALGPMYTALAALVMPATLVAAIIAIRQGNPDAPLYLAARLASAACGGIATLTLLGVFPPGLPSTVLLPAGAIIEAILIALMLYRCQRRRSAGQVGALLEEAVAAAETRARSDFLGRFSHEVRTPLNGILGMTELLADSSLTPRQREYTLTIRASGENLLLLVNDALDWSRLESGRLDLVNVDFDLPQVVADSLEPVQLRAEEKHLELVMDIDPALPSRVTGDPARVRQVLCNLLGNAIRYTHRGEVHVHVLADATPHMVRFEVSDTGSGIPRDRLATLFNDVQEDRSRGEGSLRGFGLVIARRLVERMGGRIGAHSEEHRGSTFWFTVPLPAAPEQAPATDSSLLAGKRLLVVDDNAAMRRVLEQLAVSWQVQVTTADNGQEALAIARTQSNLGTPFDIAIVDHNMPGMSGLQLSARFKEDPLIRHDMLIIMLTGLNIAPTEPMARNVGIRRVLTKPVSGRTLHGVLAEELARQPQIATGADAGTPLPATLRVLVVEDHPLSQKVIRGMLNKLGVRSDVVGNGQEAVDALQHNRYDLVLMDCEMPVMDGYEATRRIREREQATGRTRTPIIALSAYILNEVKERCRLAGMDAHMAKPVDLSELREALRIYSGG